MNIREFTVGITPRAIAIFLSTCIFAGVGHSDDSLLDLLKEKGVLTDKEVEAQKEVLKKEKAEQKKQEKEGFAAGLRSHNVRLYGTFMPMYTYIPADHAAGKNQTSSFELRKARFGVSGSLTKDMCFNVQFESASTTNGTSLLDASRSSSLTNSGELRLANSTAGSRT